MRIRNLLTLNDWEIRNTVVVVLFIQAAVLFLVFLRLSIPIIQVPVAFIYLTFIPGMLILRILRLHELGNVRTLLYAMGLSLSSLMAVGFLLNAIFLRVGLADPISSTTLAIVLTLLVLLLCLLSFVRDREFSNPAYASIAFSSISPQILLLCLLPFATIFATFLMNYNGNNALQVILLLIVTATPFLVAFDWIPRKNYLLLIFVLSFAMLFRTALLSSYIWGSDLSVEVALSRIVVLAGAWNLSIASDYAGMLSLVMLGPIYTLFSNISSPLVFKLLYPFLFSFVPLGLFIIYKKQAGEKVAFFSCFFFMTFQAFFIHMPQLGRQEIGELFLMLIVLLIVEGRRTSNRAVLLLVFGAALAVSHYGTSYVFMVILAVALPITYVISRKVVKTFSATRTQSTRDLGRFATFFVVFSLMWYIIVSPFSQPFVTVLSIGQSIVSDVREMFNPAYNQPLAYVTTQLIPLQIIDRDIFLMSLFFILVGLTTVFFHLEKTRFRAEFIGFAAGALVFLFGAAVLPLVAQALQSDRLIALTFIFLAPFCIIGLQGSLGLLSSSIARFTKRTGALRLHKSKLDTAVAIFLALWVVFNSALVYQVFDQPKVGRFALDAQQDFLRLNGQELSNAAWLGTFLKNGSVAYADVNKAVLVEGIIGSSVNVSVIEITSPAINTTNIRFFDSYVFLGSYDLRSHSMLVYRPVEVVSPQSVQAEPFGNPGYIPTSEIPQANVIFNDGGSQVLFVS